MSAIDDILNGRGKLPNVWEGDVNYRIMIKYYKIKYIIALLEEWKIIAQCIISIIQGLNPLGRLLDFNKSLGTWYEIEDEKAIMKARKVLQDVTPTLQEQITPSEYYL